MWRSKLGNDFPKEEIDRDEKKYKAELARLRKLPGNRCCADCGEHDTTWASINLGVFLCMSCGSHHLGIGTHISLPKGCAGTYLWGPDEIEQMASIGNAKASHIYGGEQQRPSKTAPHWQWRQYIVDKYEHKKFAPKSHVVHVPKPLHIPTLIQTPVTSAPTYRDKGNLEIPTFPPMSPKNQQQQNTVSPDFESPGSSPTGVVRPAHHLSPLFPKSLHHGTGGAANGGIVRITARAGSMEFDTDEDLYPSKARSPTRKRRKTPVSPAVAVVTSNEAMSPTKLETNGFFGDFGI